MKQIKLYDLGTLGKMYWLVDLIYGDRIEQLAVEEANRQYFEEMERISLYNNWILRAIEKSLGKQYYDDVLGCLAESGGCDWDRFSLVRNPKIEKQKEDWGSFDHILLNQYCNGGFSGDDFAGFLYIPLREDLYLKTHYQM